MNFHLGCRDIRIVGGRFLSAKISVKDQWKDVLLDLDSYIGNHNGRLTWGRGNFSAEARNVRILKDHDGWAPVLYATLLDSSFNDRDSAIDLAQCISVANDVLVCDPNMRFYSEPVKNSLGGIMYFRDTRPETP